MRTLAERLTWAREQKGLTQDALAKASGVSQSTIGNLESGLRQTARKILEIATALDVDPMWLANGQGTPKKSKLELVPSGSDTGFLPSNDSPFIGDVSKVRVGANPQTVPVRAVRLRLQAGVSGFIAEPDMTIDSGYFEVPASVIADMGLNPADLLVMGVKGRSMEPMMFEDDKVLVDTSSRTPRNMACFALNWNGEACIKVLLQQGGDWYLHSMNPEFGRINVRSGQCSIVGEVVWQPSRVLKGRL